MHRIIPTWKSKNPSVLHHIEEWCYMGPRKYVNLEQTMIIKQNFIKMSWPSSLQKCHTSVKSHNQSRLTLVTRTHNLQLLKDPLNLPVLVLIYVTQVK